MHDRVRAVVCNWLLNESKDLRSKYSQNNTCWSLALTLMYIAEVADVRGVTLAVASQSLTARQNACISS